jgi:c-di-GMP-binding flagellar brake protein YcgR
MILDERLRYHRETLDVPVSLTYATRKRQRAHLMNLSQGGIGVRLQRLHETRGPVKVSFTLPGTRLALKIVAEVVWKDRQGNVGIRFTETEPRTKRQLRLWLERQYFTS